MLLVIIGIVAAASTELKVHVYEGPKECDAADTIKVGDKLGMHYTGTIDDSSKAGTPGKQFDSSSGRGVFERTIGVGDLIQGWDTGLLGLCKGAKAILVIPPEMGYGTNGAGDVVPGGATLKFDVEVVSVSAPPPQPNLFEELDTDLDGVLTPQEILVHFRRGDPNAMMPQELMEKEDKNKNGVVSLEEFGGPRMPWPWCLEMLYRNSEPTTLGLAVRWLCQRKQPDQGTNDHDEL
mmetsp:Transcript_45366/g.105945  ORF Transcript_45366/g.105945 Transcript_45366/m.105945 type:complete len:236 (-) Transcript_45366:46-753(-)